MGRGLISQAIACKQRPPFPAMSEDLVVLSGISPSFPELSQTSKADYPRVTHPCAALLSPEGPFSLDLHVLSTPPAFVLSQDQTLQFELGTEHAQSRVPALLFGMTTQPPKRPRCSLMLTYARSVSSELPRAHSIRTLFGFQRPIEARGDLFGSLGRIASRKEGELPRSCRAENRSVGASGSGKVSGSDLPQSRPPLKFFTNAPRGSGLDFDPREAPAPGFDDIATRREPQRRVPLDVLVHFDCTLCDEPPRLAVRRELESRAEQISAARASPPAAYLRGSSRDFSRSPRLPERRGGSAPLPLRPRPRRGSASTIRVASVRLTRAIGAQLGGGDARCQVVPRAEPEYAHQVSEHQHRRRCSSPCRNRVGGLLGDSDRVAEALRHLLSPVEPDEQRVSDHGLRSLAIISLDLAAPSAG